MATNNNQAMNAIKAYLERRAAEDVQFTESYAKPGKSIDECYRYILGEARKRGSAVCMTDDEVYGMAVHYYDEDNIKVATAPAARVTHTAPTPVELSEQEKEAARESARKAYEQQCLREEAERDARRRHAEAERKKAEAEKKAEQRKQRQSMFTAPSLFDL